jgi:hypothetical protein
MDSSGAVQYINREFGIETEGTWYSNSGFRWSRSERAFSYPGKGLVYDYGWERASYGGLKPAIATPINKLATSEAEEKAEEAMHEYYEGDSCYDDDLELPPSAYFDHYQRYDGDFNTDLGNLDEGIEDEFGMTASDYNGNAEEEFYFWLDHPEFIESAAYRDLTEMESGLGLTNFRFFMQAWLDLYEPDYTKLYHRVKPTAHVVSTKTTTETTDKRAAIQEVINIATKNLTEPVKFSLGEKKAGAE